MEKNLNLRYVDALENLHIRNNMVQFDFVVLDPSVQTGENNEVAKVIDTRLIMNLPAFTQLYNMVNQLAGQLTERGMLVPQTNETESDVSVDKAVEAEVVEKPLKTKHVFKK